MSDNELRIGAKYLIRTAEEEDTIGLFSGYIMIGSESALVIEMEGGKIRYQPVSQISYIDLLESSDSEKESKKGPEILYG